MLLQLVYPTTNTKLPLIENKKKSPKIQFLDTGIINNFLGVQSQLLSDENIDEVYSGKIAEHITRQELLAINPLPLTNFLFWVKEKKQSNAEVDFILQYKSQLIPVEVKAGKTGRLRSFMEFINASSGKYAIRVYSGQLQKEKFKTTQGNEFYLLNLPFYLVNQIENYLEWFIH